MFRFFFHPDFIENPPYFVCFSSFILEFCYFSLVLAGLVSCLSPPSFLGVSLLSLLLCILLFWLCVVYVVVNVKNRISPRKRRFLDGFGWVPQDPIPQKGVWCTFTVFIVSCFGCSSNVCFFICFLLFFVSGERINCFCPLFVVLFYG